MRNTRIRARSTYSSRRLPRGGTPGSIVLDAFIRHAGAQPVVVASSGVIPQTGTTGANPPHRKAADRYNDTAGELICIMEWPDADAPTPVVFAIDADEANIVRHDTIALSAGESTRAMRASAARRLAAVIGAAAAVGHDVAEQRAETPRAATAGPTGPEQIRAAITADRGGDTAPDTTIGFGRAAGRRRCPRAAESLPRANSPNCRA